MAEDKDIELLRILGSVGGLEMLLPKGSHAQLNELKDLAIECLQRRADVDRRTFDAGYIFGFNVSGEGWNGEYPFGDDDLKPQDDAMWIKHRERAWKQHVESQSNSSRQLPQPEAGK